jgi:hypothetical protein
LLHIDDVHFLDAGAIKGDQRRTLNLKESGKKGKLVKVLIDWLTIFKRKKYRKKRGFAGRVGLQHIRLKMVFITNYSDQILTNRFPTQLVTTACCCWLSVKHHTMFDAPKHQGRVLWLPYWEFLGKSERTVGRWCAGVK